MMKKKRKKKDSSKIKKKSFVFRQLNKSNESRKMRNRKTRD